MNGPDALTLAHLHVAAHGPATRAQGRRTPRLHAHPVLAIAAEVCGVSLREAQERKTEDATDARRIACAILRTEGLTYPAIASALGFSCHTSALHYVRSHKGFMDEEATYFLRFRRATLARIERLRQAQGELSDAVGRGGDHTPSTP